MIDLHAHILHGLDDGPKSLEESIEMCRMSYADGVKTIVATPHTLNGLYRNDRPTVLQKVKELNHALEDEGSLAGIPNSALTVLPGSDVHLTGEVIRLLDEGKIATLGDGGVFLLIEFPVQNIPHGTEEALLRLMKRGLIPIISHPERNVEIGQKPRRYREMIQMGCLGQLTAMSLTGGFGPQVKRVAERLLKEGLVHVIASDTHSSDGRSPKLSSGVRAAAELVGEEKAMRLVRDNPQSILEGRLPMTQ